MEAKELKFILDIQSVLSEIREIKEYVGNNFAVYKSNFEALVFDTPASEEASVELINWIENNQKSAVKGVVVTHFHWDCLGGLNEFHAKNIPSYASSNAEHPQRLFKS